MSKCMQHNTIKVPQGNAWQLLLPLKTAHWVGKDLVTETIDYRALEDVQVLIDGVVWEDRQMTEDGPLCNIPADMPLGPHNTVITATYFGVEVKAAYFENFTIVAWSFESNVGEHLLDAPLVSEAAYIYVSITDDVELEELKQQYRDAIAACETARLQYEAAKEEFDEKAEQLNDVAQQTTLTEGIQSVLQRLAPKATTAQLNTATETLLTAISHIDIDTTTLAKEQTLTNALQSVLTALNPMATTSDVTTAKDAILEALSHISPEDPYSQALAAFFGITPPVPNAVPMTQQEVEDDLDELWNLIITQ